MIEEDRYDTLRERAESRIRVERSEFIAIAFPLEKEEAFAGELDEVARQWHDATHHCWAFRLFDGGSVRARSSDAGEPSGSAGKPILSAIESVDLFDVAVVVVRYFGGIKLGTGGLSRAYRQAARDVLESAPRDRRYLYERLAIAVTHPQLSTFYRLIAPPDVVLAGEEFGETNRFELDVRRNLAERFVEELREKRLQLVGRQSR